MTNDTSKLDGALLELGDTMADNLVAMGVSGASAADGLTTLANNILDIAPSVGGITPTVSIDLSKSPTLICRGATVDIMALVHADYDDESIADVDLKGYLQGATVTFKNGNDSIGYAVSDNDGIATLTINDITMGNYSIVGSFDGTGTDYESATSIAMTFTVNDYPTITLSADKTTVNVGETVTFTITAMYNNTPVVGYPIQLYKDGSSMGSLYAGITNNNGECVISYIIPNDAVNFTINSNQLSNNLNINVTNYIFFDDCDSADGLSNYATSIPLRQNGASSLSYNSTNNYYVLNNDTDYESFIEILPLTGVTNDFKVNAYGKVLSQSQVVGFGVYFDTNNWYHMKVEQNYKVWVSKNVNGVFSETSYNTSESTSNNIRVEWVIDDTNNEFTVNFKREDGTLVLSKTQTIPSLTSTTKYGFVSSWWRNAKVAIYEIKAEQL